MARTKSKWPKPDLKPLVEFMGGMDAVIKQLGIKRVIDEVGIKRVIDEVGLEALLSNLSPGQRHELKRRLEQ